MSISPSPSTTDVFRHNREPIAPYEDTLTASVSDTKPEVGERVARPQAIESGVEEASESDVRTYPIVEIVIAVLLGMLIRHAASREYHRRVTPANLYTGYRMRRTLKSVDRGINTTAHRHTRPTLVHVTEDRDKAQSRESDNRGESEAVRTTALIDAKFDCGDIFTSTAALDCDIADLFHNRGSPRVSPDPIQSSQES